MNATDNSTDVPIDGPMPVVGDSDYSRPIEIVIYGIVVLLGGPLNLYAFYNTVRAYTHSTSIAYRLLILKISLNIADLITIFVYSLTQFIWLSTYWVSANFETNCFLPFPYRRTHKLDHFRGEARVLSLRLRIYC